MRFPIKSRLATACATLCWFVAALVMFNSVAPRCSGQTLFTRWKVFQKGTANGNDDGFAAKVGPDGNVVMTSNSAFTSSFYEIVTAKYDGSTGALIWQQRSHATNDRSDKVLGMAMDDLGNVVVAGLRDGLEANSQSFFVAKYAAADGALLWQRAFNTGCYFVAVEVDARGDIIATGPCRIGPSSDDFDIYTFKFASGTGQTLWENHYSSPPAFRGTWDSPTALALDAAGNAFVTGSAPFGQFGQTLTLKIGNADGGLLWSKQRMDSGTSGSSGVDIATDAAGDALVAITAPQGRGGLRVVKYSGSDGTELWVNLQDGGQRDEPSSLAVDPQGNVAVTGYTYVSTTTNDDIFTRKMDGITGQTLWTRTYDGGVTASGRIKDDRGVSVGFDAAGNTVVAGYSNNVFGNGPDTMILRYATTDGAAITQQRIAISTGDDYPGSKDAMVIGPGHITVVGGSYTATGDDAFTLRLGDPANPTVVTRAPVQVGSTTAQVGAGVNANGSTTKFHYVYGTSPVALNQATAAKSIGLGFAPVESVDTLTGLLPSTTYFYQAIATGNGQTVQGEILQFTTFSNNSYLSSLTVGNGTLSPVFNKNLMLYSVTLPTTTPSISITPTLESATATMTLNGNAIASGSSSGAIPLSVGTTMLETIVTAQDGSTRTYSVAVVRLPEKFTFHSVDEIQVTSPGFNATGTRADIFLDYAPPTGTNLVLVNNTGGNLVQGHFTNIDQGQVVILPYQGAFYRYVMNYYGGDGNDVVLIWAHNKIYSWGYNSSGQLGLGNTTNVTVPTAIPATGALAGKTILNFVSGGSHNLALCSDGSLFSWGSNQGGQLGNGTNTISSVPIDITHSGALAGKSVISIAAGPSQSYALCSDGSLLGWGSNTWGVLGDGTMTNRNRPVLAQFTGFLAGKSIVSVVADSGTCQVLCSDGSIAGWGINFYGQLGSTAPSSTLSPVEVTQNGALLGRTVTSLSAGGDSFFLYRCYDGTAAGSGWNPYGQLGNGTTGSSKIPVQVSTAGVLNGKSIGSLSAGFAHVLALCSDGTPVAWGFSNLGTASPTSSTTPVATDISGVLAGKTIRTLSAGIDTSVALCTDGFIAAWGGGFQGALGNGGTANSILPVATNGPATGEKFNALAQGATAQHHMAIAGFPLSDDSAVASISLSSGTLSPSFSSSITSYTSSVTSGEATLKITAVTSNEFAMLKVNGISIESGNASPAIPILPGDNTISIAVTAETGATTTYTITVNRPPLVVSFDSAETIGTTAAEYSADGNTVELSLNFPPAPGTNLTVVNVTDPAFIDGEFVNLPQGRHVFLTHAGVTYDFIANYFGGTGNEFVLQWAATQVHAWGANNYGQLGDNSTTGRLTPVATDDSGILSKKTIVSVAGGYLHSLALCSDGTLASWGYNVYGQLGNGGSAASSIPVEVDRSGALAGKTVIAISAGPFHNLALCSDGSIAAWGYNNYGQLGTGDSTTRQAPVLVSPDGALAGKQVVGITAGAYQSFALCADGSVVAWGYNDEGELGDNSTTTRLAPVAVDGSGALANKKIASISAGQYHTMALCTDGTMVAWGYNQHGELGNQSTTSSSIPIAINSFGALAGKTVSAIAAGGSHTLALCTDGTLATWGLNDQLQLGTAGIGQSLIPIEISPVGATTGKSIIGIAAGSAHSIVQCSDASLAAWGDNSSGQLGNSSTTSSEVPSLVDSTAMASDSRFMSVATGTASLHNLAIVGVSIHPQSILSPDHANLALPPLEDFDHDGISNLVERAFALDPTKDSSGELPQPRRIGDHYVIEFTEVAGLTGITYGVESSVNLQPGSWLDVPDSGSGPHHIFSVPVDDTQSIFFRMKVSE